MKKLILSAVMVASFTAASYGQGTMTMGNQGNSDTSSTATSNGLYWIDTDGDGPGLAQIMDYNVNNNWTHLNINWYGGANAGSLSLIVSYIGTDFATYGYLTTTIAGEFGDTLVQGVYNIPGVALSGTAYLRQQVWFGADPDWATAVLNEAPRAQVDWLNATGGGGEPPALPVSFTGMPATVLTFVPEPNTFALGAIGAAALAFFRRRK